MYNVPGTKYKVGAEFLSSWYLVLRTWYKKTHMKKNYVIGLLAAVAVGAIAGVLLAPAKGKDLRNQIKDKRIEK